MLAKVRHDRENVEGAASRVRNTEVNITTETRQGQPRRWAVYKESWIFNVKVLLQNKMRSCNDACLSLRMEMTSGQEELQSLKVELGTAK